MMIYKTVYLDFQCQPFDWAMPMQERSLRGRISFQMLKVLPCILACTLAGIVSVGCGSLKNKTTPSTVSFSEQEIRSRSWTDKRGELFQLLDWTEIDSKFHGEILIAKYGSANAGFTNCFDIYRVNNLGEGPDGVIPTIASDLLAPASSDAEMIAERRSFDLLVHDNGRENVISILFEETRDRAVFVVTRERISMTAKQQRMRLRYKVFYDERSGIHTNPRAEMWNINEPVAPTNAAAIPED